MALPPQPNWQPPSPVPVSAATAPMAGLPLGDVPDVGTPPTEPVPTSTPKRRRRMTVDAEAVVDRVLNSVDATRDDRASWVDLRLVRYAKLRGWLQDKTWPWDDASNQHIPLMQANSLRIQAGLHNAVLGVRPVMVGKALRRDQKDAAEKASDLIDYQLFVEADGEEKIERFIQQFVNDGTVIAFCPWVKDTRTIVDVRRYPIDDSRTMVEYMADLLPQEIPGLTELRSLGDNGLSWSGTWQGPNGEVDVAVEVYDGRDDMLEIEMTWQATVFDGPTVILHELEDVVVPMRAQNCQPITPSNPFGAPWVARLIKIDVDTVARRQADGVYDLLTQADLDELKDLAGVLTKQDETYQEDRLTQEKEAQAGLSTTFSGSEEDRTFLTLVEWYGRWDCNKDGLDEDVIFSVTREGRKLLRARYLTEQYPGLPPRRPFAEARFIPVDGQFYGIGLPELMEGVNDLLHGLINQNIDKGEIANLPIMLYRASSGIKPEVMRVRPGDWVPVDNPQTDALPVQFPHSDQTWSFNMISLIQQFAQQLVQIGPIQMGQVPQGKASALRTVGTTMAILQQGAAMPEQILRRLFMGLKQIWEQFHMLNTRFLPPRKQYLIAGKPPDDADAYRTIAQPAELGIPVMFDFQATLLNTNKGVMSQALTGLGTALFNPLAFQMKLVGPEQFYNWCKDLVQANQLDPQRYLQKPPDAPAGPRVTVQDAIAMLLEGQMPPTDTVGPTDQFLMELKGFEQSDEFGRLHISNVGIWRQYGMALAQKIQQEQQQAQLQQAAQQFAQMLGNQGQGQGGQPQGGAPPPMQSEPGSASEQAGADMSHGAG